jgi:hypothetical protein
MTNKANLTARAYLSIPYRIEAFSYEAAPGRLMRRVCHPELADCAVEDETITGALERLDRRRVEVILALLSRHEAPPVPRPPLVDADPEGQLERLGLTGQIAVLRQLETEDCNANA